ncbi:hypothetical protein BC832DRAFT_539538 [Gaertneriomyces semiglobifer]|nr:hypothetical protein BC832DRAFT_539538 [Gaertneriomyces semiglobifer]
MDELVPSIVRRRTFEVRFEPADQAAQSQRDLSNTCLANEEAEMVDRDPGRGITSYSVCFGVEGSRPDTLGQGHLATPVCDNAEFYEQWTCNVPFPKFKPAPGTGLWSYLDGSRVLGGTGTLITMVNGNAEEPPLAFSPVMEGGDIPADDAERSPVLVLACDLSCYEYSTRTIALRQPPDPFQFTSKKLNTLWSKVRLESDVSGGQLRIRPKEGLWVGTYGGHGVEFLLARYDAMGALLQFYKLTGDVNVPRGEVSLQVLLLEELEESIAPWVVSSPGMATMYAGFGTVATVGYRHPTKIDSQVIFISEREVAVYWQDLRKVSRYIKVDL